MGSDQAWERIRRWCRLFQSTLPHGERLLRSIPMAKPSDFNPRSRMGSDRLRHARLRHAPKISIHAPAWGATWVRTLAQTILRFQSTLPHGERRQGSGSYSGSKSFQSTLPHGERHTHNPIMVNHLLISIHAPAWGATVHVGYLFAGDGISIHAPAWGATAIPVFRVGDAHISIHAPAWGATVLADALVVTF